MPASRRSRYWGLAARGLAWSLVLLAVVTLVAWFFVESSWLRERARQAVVAQASSRLEREVGVARLDFDLWPPRVTLEGIVIAGAPPPSLPEASPGAPPEPAPAAPADPPPLLTAERLIVGFGPRLLQALRGRGVVDLRSIDVLEPRVRLEVYPDGSTNLPPILEQLGGEGERERSALEVRLGALHVAGGRLDLDERSLPLDVEATGIRAVLGRLAATDDGYHLLLDSRRLIARLPLLAGGSTPADERPPLEVRLGLEADFGGGTVEVSRLVLAGERLDLEASGRYHDGRLEAASSGHLDLAVLEAVGWASRPDEAPGRPVGVVSLDGTFSYEDGAWTVASDLATSAVTAGQRRLAPLTARVELAGRGAEVDSLSGSARGRSLDLSVSGSYRDHRLELALDGWVDAQLAADLELMDDLEGRIGFDGELERTADSWEMSADLVSEEVRYDTYVLRDASLRLGVSPTAVRAESIRAAVVGGTIGGAVTVDLAPPRAAAQGASTATPRGPGRQRLATGPPDGGAVDAASLAASYASSEFPVVTLDLVVDGVDVRRFAEMARLPVQGLAGRVSGELLYAFASAEPRAGRGRGELAFSRLDVAPPSSEGRRPLELAGRVPFEVDDGLFRVAAAELRTAGQRLVLSGDLDLDPAPDGDGRRGAADRDTNEPAAATAPYRADVEFELETENPRAVLRLLPALYTTDQEPIWEPQRGRGTVHGRITADPRGFTVDLDLDLAAVALAATEADRVRGTLTVDSAGVQVADFEFLRGPRAASEGEPTEDDESAWDGRLEVAASVPFSDPPPGFGSPPFAVRLATRAWPLADAAPWVPFEIPADGLADVVVELEGDAVGDSEGDAEADLDGELGAISGRLEGSVSEPVLAGLAIDGTLTGAISFTPDELFIERAALELAAGRLELGGSYRFDSEALDLDLTAERLDLARSPFSGWIEAPLGGFLTLGAEIGGTLAEPRVVAEMVGDELALGETVLGRRGASRLDLTWRGGEVEARGSLLGLLRLEGGGRLDADGADVVVAVASDEIGSLLEFAVGAEIEETSGALEGSLRITGAADALAARLTLDRLSLEQPTRRLANLEPVVVAWSDGVLRLESLFMGEERTATELFVAGDLVGPEGELDLVVQSSVDARWLAIYLPGVTLTGQVNVLGVVRGSLAEPALDGQADLAGARMIVSGFPHAFERLSGLLFFYPDRVVIDSGTARLAGGRVRADGVIEMPPDDLWGFELRLSGDQLDLRYPEDWRLQGDAELTLSGTIESRELTGVVTLERAEYQRDFKLGLMGLLRSLFERRAETVRETEELLVDTRLNVLVEGPEALYVKTNLADIQGDLDLSVRGSLAEPVLLGDVRLLRGGEIDIGGAEYKVERGTLSFSNPFRNAPRLDLVASAQVKEYDVRLNVYGPLEKLQTTFSSNPPLADVDIVSLLTTGSADTLRTFGSDGLLRDPSSSAESFLAGQAASLAGERVGTLLGLDQVQISPLTGGTADLSTARFTVGKRLGSEFFVTYSYDPSRSREEIYELSWQINSSLALILTRSDEGSFAVDLEWNTTF